MKCPFCGFENTYTVDTRAIEEGTTVRRRRSCSACEKRFSTYEKLVLKKLMVQKRSGLRRPFEPSKIQKCIANAMHKRDPSGKRANEVANQIISNIEKKSLHEITSRQIIKMIIEELTKIDEVACIRYASIYKEFNNAADFDHFAKRMKEKE